MLRHRRFLTFMHRLALMGALLMIVAPLVSRWVQSQASTRQPLAAHAIDAGQGMPMAGMDHAGMAHMHHSDHAMAMDMAMPMPMEHGDGMPMPAGHDGAACDYCVLAAGLLPFVLVLLLLPLLQPAVGGLVALLVPPRTAFTWPAHAARGPPLHA